MKKINKVLITMIASSLFLLAATPSQAVDVTLRDPAGDVFTIDLYEQSSLVTHSPDINIDNIDLTQLTYTKTGGSATLTLEVKGSIENRGTLADVSGEYPENVSEMKINYVHYQLMLGTKLAGSAGEIYTVDYVNKTCQYSTTKNDSIPLPSSQFSTAGSKLTVTIPLDNADEMYDYLNATTTFLKFNLTGNYENITNPDEFEKLYTLLTDIAPNPALAVYSVDAPNVGSIGESIQFNSTVIPLTGLPPYSYEWRFGDGATSTKQNPTHIYTKAGTFMYNLTVTDQANAKAYDSAAIKITGEGNGGGSASTPLLLFLAVIIIIAVIGIVVLVIIIRRR